MAQIQIVITIPDKTVEELRRLVADTANNTGIFCEDGQIKAESVTAFDVFGYLYSDSLSGVAYAIDEETMVE